MEISVDDAATEGNEGENFLKRPSSAMPKKRIFFCNALKENPAYIEMKINTNSMNNIMFKSTLKNDYG